MSDSINTQEHGLLDTSIITGDLETAPGTIADDERIFVPAAGIKSEELAEALREEHTPEEYPGFDILFQVVGKRVMSTIKEKTTQA